MFEQLFYILGSMFFLIAIVGMVILLGAWALDKTADPLGKGW